MQLDRTAIVISQRTSADLIDLSLIVMRVYFGPIALFAFLGIFPFALLDFILLLPLTQYDLLLISSRMIGEVGVLHFRYLCIVTGLILVQAPLALSPVTYFIGQAVFIERPSVREVFKAVWGRLGAMIYVLGILRFSLVAFVPAVLLFLEPVFQPEVEIVLYLVLMCGVVFLVRGFRPFAAEILLLERCPVLKHKSKKDQLIYSLRSKSLHASLSNDLFGIHLGVASMEVLATGALTLGVLFAIGMMVGTWEWGLWMDLFLYPLTLWTIATWGTIIRFLWYMNSRIRIEGWEIELRLKAEAQRVEELAV